MKRRTAGMKIVMEATGCSVEDANYKTSSGRLPDLAKQIDKALARMRERTEESTLRAYGLWSAEHQLYNKKANSLRIKTKISKKPGSKPRKRPAGERTVDQ